MLLPCFSKNPSKTTVYPCVQARRQRSLSKVDLTCFLRVDAVLLLLIEDIQGCLGSFLFLDGAVGHCVSHDAELAEEDLPEEQIDPRVEDLVEGGQADRCEKKVAIQLDTPA